MENKELKKIATKISNYLATTDNPDSIYHFLRDLLSENEIIEFSRRFEVAILLDQKISYTEIEKQTGMSSTTMARISKFLHNGNGGYQDAIIKIKSQK
ncbi:hypothetical protein H7169_03455 [Candidatus Gracilibacteria bacterium]|nr:hypothetical protein [Candidatus Gracilibacteria bacterium]